MADSECESSACMLWLITYGMYSLCTLCTLLMIARGSKRKRALTRFSGGVAGDFSLGGKKINFPRQRSGKPHPAVSTGSDCREADIILRPRAWRMLPPWTSRTNKLLKAASFSVKQSEARGHGKKLSLESDDSF